MKALSFILLSGLFLVQPISLSLNASAGAESVLADKKLIKKPVNIHLLKETVTPRSVLPSIPGYVQDNQLYICFTTPIEDESLIVKDARSGETVYSGTFTGDTLIIELTNPGDSYTIEIV